MKVKLTRAIHSKYLVIPTGIYEADKIDDLYLLILNDTYPITVAVDASKVKEISKPKVWVATIVYNNGDEVFIGHTKQSVTKQVYDWIKDLIDSQPHYKGKGNIISKNHEKAIKEYFDDAVANGNSTSCDIVEKAIL